MKFTFGEINIVCHELQRSLHFYRDLLGFTQVAEEAGAIHLRSGNQLFLLLPVAKQDAPVFPSYCSVPTYSMDLMVDDLKAAYDFFLQNNVTIEQAWTSDAVMFVIRDPDGMFWEIIQSGID